MAGWAEEKKRMAYHEATPRWGIFKGFIIILIGLMMAAYSAVSTLDLAETTNPLTFEKTINIGFLAGGIIWTIGIFGIFLWRGIKAFVDHDKKRVTGLNLGLWLVLFCIMVIATLSLIGIF